MGLGYDYNPKSTQGPAHYNAVVLSLVGAIRGYRLAGAPEPAIVTLRDNANYEGPLIFLLYHYYRVGGPLKTWVITWL